MVNTKLKKIIIELPPLYVLDLNNLIKPSNLKLNPKFIQAKPLKLLKKK